MLNHIRDGQHRQTITKGKANYWPNRFENAPPAPKEQGGHEHHHGTRLTAAKARARAPKFQEHFSQATLFYNSMSPLEKQHIANALGFELSHVDEPEVCEAFIHRVLNHVDHELACKVAEKIGATAPASAARPNHRLVAKNLTQFDFPASKPTIKSRRIAILVGDGFDEAFVVGIKAAITASSALAFVIGPRRGPIKSAGGSTVKADFHLESGRSTMYDAIIIPPGAASAATLSQDGRAVHWVREAFGHCKVIGAVGEGVAFVREALGIASLQFSATSGDDTVVTDYGIVTTGRYSVGSAAADIQIGKEEKGWFSKFAYELSQHRCFQRELDGLLSKVAF